MIPIRIERTNCGLVNQRPHLRILALANINILKFHAGVSEIT